MNVELWYEIGEPNSVLLLDSFLNSGGSLYVNNPNTKRSLLHSAVERSDSLLIERLIQVGFDIDFVAECGYSAIFQALDLDIDTALQHNTDPDFKSTQHLMSLGASLDVKDEEGRSLTEYAQTYGGELFKSEFEKMLKIWKHK